MPHSRVLVRCAVLTATLLVPAVLAPAASAEPRGALVTVVHGVRGLVADVRIDGAQVLSGFAVQRITDPLPLAAGSHHLQVWPTGAAPTGKPVLDTTIKVTAGEQATAALGVAPGGRPMVTVYDDKTLLPMPGSTALAVRGLADAPPNIKVLANERTLAQALRPGGQGLLQVPAGTYSVSAAGVGVGVIVPPQDVPVATGRAVVLYLIGSQSQGTLGWVAQTVRPTSAAAPRRISTGVGPLPSPPSRTPMVLLIAPLAAAAVLLKRLRRAHSA